MIKKLFAALLTISVFAAAVIPAAAAGYGLSPALGVMRAETVLEKKGVSGTPVLFTAEDFTEAAGQGIDYITLIDLPPAQSGVLALSGSECTEGQTIAADSLAFLTYTPKLEGLATATFTFRFGAEEWLNTDVMCRITMSGGVNAAPITSDEKVSTVGGVPLIHTLAAGDPDGDAVTVRVTSYPENGYLAVGSDGHIVYTPIEGFTGKDEFRYVAADKYGASSEEATVGISVEDNKYGIAFADMDGNDAYAAAVVMSQNCVMTYTYKSGEYYFSPYEKVTRIDFLVMLISALGLEDGAEPCEDTLFEDDDILTPAAKGYLALALRTGIVSLDDGYFNPTGTVTFAEAELMANSALTAGGYGGIVTGTGQADTEMTKADVARMLMKTIKNK